MAKEVKPPMPAGIGAGKPVHPFAVTVEEPVAVSTIDTPTDHTPRAMVRADLMQNAIVPDGYGIKYHAYHTITEGVFLPSGTSLPGGAVLPMSSVADFPMVLPQGKRMRGDGTLIGFKGSKLPGGVMVPVSRQHWHLVSDQQAYLTAWPDRDAEEDQSGDHQDSP